MSYSPSSMYAVSFMCHIQKRKLCAKVLFWIVQTVYHFSRLFITHFSLNIMLFSIELDIQDLYNAVLFWIMNMMVVIYWLSYNRLKKALYYLNMFTLDILFRQITTFIKVCVAFVFGLQTL